MVHGIWALTGLEGWPEYLNDQTVMHLRLLNELFSGPHIHASITLV